MTLLVAALLAHAVGFAIAGPSIAARQEEVIAARTRLVDCFDAARVAQAKPETSEFQSQTQGFNRRIPVEPLVFARPRNVEDVQETVKCAKAHGMKVSPKSGGHSYANHGLGGEDGHVVIDLRYLNTTTVDPATGIATIGPGMRLGNVATELYKQGKRALSHGTCPGVGLGGHVLHGGYGLSSHSYGLMMDKMIEAEVVLANGSVVTASKTQNADLFWALRGAGSSFGIVTSMKYESYPAPDANIVFSYPLRLDAKSMSTVFTAMQEYGQKSMPREMNMRLFVGNGGSSLQGVYYGSRANYTAAIQPILDDLKGLVTAYSGRIQEKGWIDTLLANSNGRLESTVDYKVPQENFYAKSLMTAYPVPVDAVTAFGEYFASKMKPSRRSWYLQIDIHGGPNSYISSIPADETSYPHRDKLFKYQFHDGASLGGVYPEEGFGLLDGWIDTIKGAMGNETAGMYYNYADSRLLPGEAQREYWMGNYPRLEEIKRKWDPDNLFSNPQAVGRNGA